ncbi:MAG: hypothetical protein HN719_02875 [Alphaproteobacteria bacterium]|jgi:hypothetical protein|nr:hypothetical protein [Alphaproteobacteria bacterium]
MKSNSVPAQAVPPEAASPFSIFEGLELAGVTPAMIALFSDTDIEEVNGWRRGTSPVPWGRVVFLTLILSRIIDELIRTHDQWGPAPKVWHLHMRTCLENTQAILGRQDDDNKEAPAGAFRQGERMFEAWLEQDAAYGWTSEAAGRVVLGEDTTGLDI